MAESVLSRPGADLAYEEQGDGPLAGYSHGILLSRRAEQAMDLLDWAPVIAGHRLVRYDARGHGLSTGQPVEEQYRWPALADDLIALIDHVSGGEPVDWAGQSMGTGTLLWAVTKAPERFRRLVLMIPPTIGEARAAARTFYRTSADTVEQQGKAAWVDQMRQFPIPQIFADVPTYTIEADVAEPLLPFALRGAAASDVPDDDALAAITHPALVLSWQTDPIHPVASAEHVAETLKDARLHVSATADDVRTWPARIADFLS